LLGSVRDTAAADLIKPTRQGAATHFLQSVGNSTAAYLVQTSGHSPATHFVESTGQAAPAHFLESVRDAAATHRVLTGQITGAGRHQGKPAEQRIEQSVLADEAIQQSAVEYAAQ